MIKKEYIYLVIAGILSGLIVFGGQVFANRGLTALEIAIIPFALGAVILLPFIILNRNMRSNKGQVWLLIFYGLVSAGTIIGQYFSLFFGISVAMVVLLLYTQPLWTILICRFILKDKIVKREIIACILVVLGVLILFNPFQTTSSYSLIGLALALFGGLSISGWIIVGSVLSKRGNHPVSSQFYGVVFSVIIIAIVALIVRNYNLPYSLIGFRLDISFSNWIWLVLFSAFAVTVNQLLYLEGTKKVATVTAGIIMLLEPVVGALLASIFLSQPLTINIIIGGVLILVANYLVITKKS